MSFRIVLCLAAVAGGVSALAAIDARAQTRLDAQPILIDVLDQAADASGDPVIVAAYAPSGRAPVVQGAGTGAVRDARPVLASYPTPSVVLGRVSPGDESRFGIINLLPQTVATFGFGADDLDARDALRDSRPELFASLVTQGYTDPAEEELKRRLQIELKRMNCYRSTIDGDWGPGSRRSVAAYFDVLEPPVDWDGDAATVELYREILLRGDVECVVAAAPARSASSGGASRPSGATVRAPTPAPAPAQTPAPTRSLRNSGTGIFR